jgi:hypothetical protein
MSNFSEIDNTFLFFGSLIVMEKITITN